MTDWRQERNDYIEGSLLDEQDRIDWQHDRDELLGLEPQDPPSQAPARPDAMDAAEWYGTDVPYPPRSRWW